MRMSRDQSRHCCAYSEETVEVRRDRSRYTAVLISDGEETLLDAGMVEDIKPSVRHEAFEIATALCRWLWPLTKTSLTLTLTLKLTLSLTLTQTRNQSIPLLCGVLWCGAVWYPLLHRLRIMMPAATPLLSRSLSLFL